MTRQEIIRDLGEGLVLRRASAADAEALAAFNADLHRDEGTAQPDEGIAVWTRDLLLRPHPTMSAGGVTVVEDRRSGAIVSSLSLIPQTWAYAGREFGVGRMELVGTNSGYRQRGLVRAQFAVAHAWSAARGQAAQIVTGIPYFYRQFGYEMVLTLGAGRAGSKLDVPALKEGETEPYMVRPAPAADAPFIARTYAAGQRRHLVRDVRSAAVWRYEIEGYSEGSIVRVETRILETPGGEPVGFLAHLPRLERGRVVLVSYELAGKVSWATVTPTVLRYVYAVGEDYARRQGGEIGGHFSWRGTDHPCYRVAERCLPVVRRPYAHYVRVADLPGFLRLIGPVLEDRLLAAGLAGHDGELKLGFFRSGCRLVFAGGRLVASEPWLPGPGNYGDATFPDLTFLQLLFGYRDLSELEYAFPDCGARADTSHALLMALFPKQASDVWALIRAPRRFSTLPAASASAGPDRRGRPGAVLRRGWCATPRSRRATCRGCLRQRGTCPRVDRWSGRWRQ